MSTSFTIAVEATPNLAALKALRQSLREHNRALVGDGNAKQLLVFLRDENGEIAGGLEAITSRSWLFIAKLLVRQDLRGKGYGSELLRTAEQEAVCRGCHGAYLYTFSFQAPEFYQRHGYQVFGVLEDFPPGHQRYFMSKSLKAAG